MNKLGQYNNDERGNYSFGYYTEDGKHVNISFRAEPDYDLDIVFSEFKNFLIASGHDVEGDIGELGIDGGDYEDGDDDDSYPQSWGKEADEILLESIDAMKQSQQAKDKFSMDHLPNNGWPFGGLTSASIPALTTADIAPLTVTDLSTNKTYSYSDWTKTNQFPTMSPLTSEQITSWSLPTQDIKSWQVNMPGTIGSAELSFKEEKNDWSPRSKDYQK